MRGLVKSGVPLEFNEFAARCSVAGLKAIQLPNFTWKVTGPQTVLVSCFGVESPVARIGEGMIENRLDENGQWQSNGWNELTGGMAEVVLLAMGDTRREKPHKPNKPKERRPAPQPPRYKVPQEFVGMGRHFRRKR